MESYYQLTANPSWTDWKEDVARSHVYYVWLW
jgi:hypothetical protein